MRAACLSPALSNSNDGVSQGQEGKAPTTTSCSPTFYPAKWIPLPMALPTDANRLRLASPFLPSCVSTVKQWLDDFLIGTRRFYLFGLITGRAPERLYLSLSPLRLGT